ncbi:MarR family transcriptional regulator|uniref:DNA-binding transcriptional regulator, MarR family n=1 Tax=Dendrosporobacter quercicolus TaxID=146817 RepID=A0A1G9SP82_9FIRM|nr:MarR family transcriptional regulator [Dendrosporobacter quercicolus]NSL48657.1 MarR family transcriptional regulator [Dendrosporobacter quercicolus DSM 1736]SDM37278.1 DNA-binding transcriptional regulator, MarR family [Dendrosporobacter quercicolus]
MNELIKWISIADRFNKMYLNKQFGRLGINSSQHMYILCICENEGITQDKLQAISYINKSNVTRALGQLEKAGFITKGPNKKDKRTIRLYPTEKAKYIYREIIRIEDEWTAFLTKEFSDPERKLLVSLIKKVGETAVEQRSGDEDE